eukprot:8259201-Lingulodinium_polyedra.AAC.1
MRPALVSISSTSCNLARATSLAASSQAMARSWSRLALRPPQLLSQGRLRAAFWRQAWCQSLERHVDGRVAVC